MSDWNMLNIPSCLESSEVDEDGYLQDHWRPTIIAGGILYSQPIDYDSLWTTDDAVLYPYYECSS